jgi:hypothetical protein
VIWRSDWRTLSRRAGPPFLAFVLVSWAAAFWLGAWRPEPDLWPFLKKAYPGADYQAEAGGRFVVRRAGEVVGYATTGSDHGYGGPLTLAVAARPDGRLSAVALLDFRDTPDILKRSAPMLRSLLGRETAGPFEIGAGVDAISGATYTTRGLLNASLAAAGRIAERAASEDRQRPGAQLGAPEWTLLALVAAGAIGRNRPRIGARARKAIRVAALLTSLVALGFLFNRPWVIAFPTRLLAGDWPSWRTHLYWYLLLGSLLLAFNRTGRNPYCPWICPFGAAQDVIGIPFGARRRRMPSGLLFTWVKRLLLWLAVLLGLLYRSPGATSYEIFAAFFGLSGTGYQMAILFFVVAAGLFVSRPFCHWVCPVDVTEQLARVVRVRALRLLGSPAVLPAARRPIPLAQERAPLPGLRRARNGLLTAMGLVCALLVLGHLHERVSASRGDVREGLMSRTFTAIAE